MKRHRISSSILLALVTTACADDPLRNEPNAQTEAGSRSSSVSFRGDAQSGGRHIATLDDCDPRDSGWAPTGGCLLKRGNVTLNEFNAFLTSPLSAAVVGHPAWRNQPSYLVVDAGKNVRVTNDGGRLHTFTKVAAFGGGRVPPLNVGLVPAPECILSPGAADPTAVAPGGRLEVDGLPVGNHRFQCCIHPWMRALIKVQADHDHGG